MGEGAYTTPKRETDVDMGGRAPWLATDGEARENEEGQVGRAKRTGAANRGHIKGGRDGEGVTIVERGPTLVPVSLVAMFDKPFLNARVQDNKVVIKRTLKTEHVAAAISEECDESSIGYTCIKGEARVRRWDGKSG